MDVSLPESGRLWASRGYPLQTDEHGYTVFVGGKWREYHNDRAKLTNELLDASDVVVLLGEPGSGKSVELDRLQSHAKARATRQVLSFDLGRYGDAVLLDAQLRRVLKPCISERLPSILFLDALDECRVNIKHAETVLEDVLREVSPETLQLVVTCRTPAWPDSLEEFLRGHWKALQDSSVSVFEIAPYSRQQISTRLRREGISEDNFFNALDDSGAHGLALQPLGLGFLTSQFKDGSTFSTNRWELYERGCAALLKESSKRRLDSGSLLLKNVQSRLQLAGLIAACVLLTNNAEITLDDTGNFALPGTWSLDVARLLTVPLSSSSGEWHASIEQYAETLQSALFIAKEDGVFVFAHRTYAEYLAAHFISSLNAPIKRVMAVLSLADGSGRLVPQLRELAAWLGHSNPEVLKLVLEAEPAMVFDSSVSLTDDTHIAAIFEEITVLVERHKFPIYDRRLMRSYRKLRHSGLAEKLESIIANRSRVVALRLFAVDVARSCGFVDDIPVLLNIALDSTENYEVRQSAASSILGDGSQVSKAALLPLIAGDSREDPDDELRGIALLAVLEAGIRVRDFIGHLTKERRANLTGMYAFALRQLENEQLQAADIVPLLSWLEPHLQSQHLDVAWEDFVVHMFTKAAASVMSHDEGWAAFGKTAWLALSNHRRLSTSRETRGFDKGLELEIRPDRRLRLLQSILDAAEGDPQIAAGQLLYGTGLLTNADGQYLIDAYQNEVGSGVKKQIVAHLALWYVYESNVVREWLLNTAGPNAEKRDPLLAQIAIEYVDCVPLESAKADRQRELLALRVKHSAPIEPAPDRKRSIDLLSAALARAEDGETWQWVYILSYLRYEGDFEHYLFPYLEVTASPLWPTLDAGTQWRLTRIALAYLRENGPVTTLAPNQTNNLEDAGIAALVFLRSTALGNSDEFGELVVKWARGLARYFPEEQPREAVSGLLGQAFQRAEAEVLSQLVELCEQYLSVDGIPRMPDFASDFMPDPLLRLLEAMLPRLASEHGFLALASFLIERHSQHAIEILIQRIQSSPDLATASTIKLLVLLAKNAPSPLVTHIWASMREQPEAVFLFAAEMQIVVAGQHVPLLQIDATVTEELFEILEKRYPMADDIKSSGFITARQHIQDFRTCCVITLRNRADAAGIAALERISARHPHLPWIASLIHEAEQKVARDSWLPYEVVEVVGVLGISAGRVIRTEAELHDAVVEELALIADKISARTLLPAVYHLWDETSERPKHEPRLCDWLASELNDRLSRKGAIVNREVQVRSHNSKGMGERTDILVDLSPPATSSKPGTTLHLVIEVKGCWNKELLTAPGSQLRDNYLKAYKAASGIYLVMWFMCDKWTKNDYRKRDTRLLISDETFDACVGAVTTACSAASTEEATITPFVIDCTY